MNSRTTGIFRFAKYFVIVIIVSGVSFMHSCKEDTGSNGANVLPKGDIISAYQTDTSTLITSMYMKDSVFTSYANASPLGSYNDPIFGETKSSIYTGVSSPVGGSTPPWADTGTVDSCVLVLPYYYPTSGAASYYANLDPQTILVYTLNGMVPSGKTLYSDSTLKYNTSPIGIAQVTPPDPLSYNPIRIKLNKSFTDNIVAKMKTNNNFYYPYFDSLVNGLYITVSNPFQLPGQGGILYINLGAGTTASLEVYYHEPSTPTTAYSIPFPVGGSSNMYFSHFDHNYLRAPFYNAHPSGTQEAIDGNYMVYLQAMSGVIGRINFPYITNWSKMNPVVINKAEVDITVNASDCPAPYGVPDNLYLLGTDVNGYAIIIPDYGQPYYGGAYNPYTNTYTFIITDYIQHVIDGKTIDRGLFIYPGNRAITANRTVIYGAQNPRSTATTNRMKLKIYYTPLKH